MSVSEDTSHEEQLAAAGHHLLEMFVAVCGAPDDPAVAEQANTALAALDRLVATE